MNDYTYKIYIFEMEGLMIQYEKAVEDADPIMIAYYWREMKTKLEDLANLEGVEVFI